MSSLLQSRRTLHVGGLAEQVADATLRAAFIPFGPIKSIDIVSVRASLFALRYVHIERLIVQLLTFCVHTLS